VVYLSTTGVFSSEQNGDWVDEESVIAPTRSGAIAAAAAEDWFDVSRPSAVVLRPSGIYGPERIPNIDRLKNREPIPVEPDSYLNLVHRDDVTRAIETLLTNYQSNQLYCVTDDQPTLRGEYYSVIAEHLGLPAPVFESAQPSGRGSANKRVSNARLKRDFHFEFEFPSFREGLLPMLTLE
jgi:nucleoside-diphosphate-sugar epimerase